MGHAEGQDERFTPNSKLRISSQTQQQDTHPNSDSHTIKCSCAASANEALQERHDRICVSTRDIHGYVVPGACAPTNYYSGVPFTFVNV